MVQLVMNFDFQNNRVRIDDILFVLAFLEKKPFPNMLYTA